MSSSGSALESGSAPGPKRGSEPARRSSESSTVTSSEEAGSQSAKRARSIELREGGTRGARRLIGEEQVDEEEAAKNAARFGPRTCNDVLFALLFIGNVITVCALTGSYYNTSIFGEYFPDDDGDGYYAGAALAQDYYNQSLIDYMEDRKPQHQIGISVGVSSGVGMVTAYMLLGVLWKLQRTFIYFTLGGHVLFWLLLALLSFVSSGGWGYGIVFLIIMFLWIALFVAWRKRIAFAAVMLKSAMQTVGRHPLTVLLSLQIVVLMVGVAIIYILAAICVGTGIHINADASVWVSIVFVCLAFYWTTQVAKNVVHVMSAGVYASEYFLGGSDRMPMHPMVDSLGHALSYNLGSIALGSLFIAPVEIIKSLLNSLRASRRGPLVLLAGCASCCLSCLSLPIKYFNLYSLTQIAVYGTGYCKSARDVYGVFKQRGFDVIVTDDLILPVVSLAAFLNGVIAGVCGAIYVWAQLDETGHATGVLAVAGVMGFVIGYLEAIIVLEVVRSGTAATFVCFAEAPEILQRKEPMVYAAFQVEYADVVNPPRVEV